MSDFGITNTYLRKLLDGSPSIEILDTILLLALSGMRFAELRKLSLYDCRGSAFRIRRSVGNKAPAREVPVHSAAAGALHLRTEGRHGATLLMNDYQHMQPSLQDRFEAFGAGVGLPTDECGIDSLRPWFIRQAQSARQPSRVIAAVIGVSGDAGRSEPEVSWAEKCTCVEAVRLPSPS